MFSTLPCGPHLDYMALCVDLTHRPGLSTCGLEEILRISVPSGSIPLQLTGQTGRKDLS